MLLSLSQLQDLCCGETPSMAEQSESQKKSVLAILDQLSVDSQSKKCRQLNAALLLVSAVEGEGELHAKEGVKSCFPQSVPQQFRLAERSLICFCRAAG